MRKPFFANPLLPTPKFQASSHILRLHSPVCVRPDRKPLENRFSHDASHKRQRRRPASTATQSDQKSFWLASIAEQIGPADHCS